MPLMDTIAAVALDFDYASQEVFYSDMERQKLFKFKLPAPHSEDELKEVSAMIVNILLSAFHCDML